MKAEKKNTFPPLTENEGKLVEAVTKGSAVFVITSCIFVIVVFSDRLNISDFSSFWKIR